MFTALLMILLVTTPAEAPQATASSAPNDESKFTVVSFDAGRATGRGNEDKFQFSFRGRYFSIFGKNDNRAIQAEGDYVWNSTRREGQFDLGLVNLWNGMQVGVFSSWRYANIEGLAQGGLLGQTSFTLDHIFKKGRFGFFATKGLKTTATLSKRQIAGSVFQESFIQVSDQVGGSGQWVVSKSMEGGQAPYLEGNVAYANNHSVTRKGVPAGMLRFVYPIKTADHAIALTAAAGWNDTIIREKGYATFSLGVEFGKWLRPKYDANPQVPVPVDIPRVRYEKLERGPTSPAPIADAGPNRANVAAGEVILDGSLSRTTETGGLRYQWTQVGGPPVVISNPTSQRASFTAAADQSYRFALTVTSASGLQSTAEVTISTAASVPAVRIVRCTAIPSVIAAGQQAVLDWVVENAASVKIQPDIGEVRASGTATVSPIKTTTYTLAATDSVGRSETCAIEIRVTASNPQVLRFEASPSTILKGLSTTLSWSTQSTSSARISGIGAVPINGSVTVSPTESTVYTLTATGPDGQTVMATTSVTITSPPFGQD